MANKVANLRGEIRLRALPVVRRSQLIRPKSNHCHVVATSSLGGYAAASLQQCPSPAMQQPPLTPSEPTTTLGGSKSTTTISMTREPKLNDGFPRLTAPKTTKTHDRTAKKAPVPGSSMANGLAGGKPSPMDCCGSKESVSYFSPCLVCSVLNIL